MTKLTCCICGEPLVKSRTDAWTEAVLVEGKSQIERAWHRACEENHALPDSPFQAAVLKAKQAIADAQRLSEEERVVFTDVVRIALTEQRQ